MPIEFDFEGARKSGATNKDISNYFKTNYNIDFDIEGALKSGATDSDVLSYLNTKYSEPVKKKEPLELGFEKPSEALRMGGLPKQEKLPQSPLKTAGTTTPSVSIKKQWTPQEQKALIEGIKTGNLIGATPEEDDYLSRIGDRIVRGMNTLNQNLAKTPEFVYNIAAIPQNIIAEKFDIPSLAVSAEKVKKDLGISNELADYYKDKIDELAYLDEKYVGANGSVTELVKKGSYKDAAKLLGEQIAESLPTTAAIAASGGLGASPTAITLGGGAVFGTSKYDELADRTDLTESEKTAISFATGLTEGLFENLGTGNIGRVVKEVITKNGVEQGKNVAKDMFVTAYKDALKRYMPVSGALQGGIEEAATTFAQNAIDIYTGVDSNKKLTDGLIDAFAVGTGSDLIISSPVLLSKDRNKQVQDKQAQVDEIDNELNNANISDDAKAVLTQKRVKVMSEMNDIIDEDVAVQKAMPEEAKREVEQIQGSIELINSDIENTGSQLAKKELETKKQELENRIDELSKTTTPTTDEQRGIEEPISGAADVTETGLGVAVKPSEEGIEGEDIQAKEVLETPSQPISVSLSDKGVYIKDGESGVIRIDGQSVVFETKDKIIELGNKDEIAETPISEFGIEKEEKLDIAVNEDNSITIDGVRYVNNFSDPQAAINTDSDGNVLSVNMETEDGKKRTFRGQRAEEIAFQYKLKQFEQNATEESIARLEQEVTRLEGEAKKPEPKTKKRSTTKRKQAEVKPQVTVSETTTTETEVTPAETKEVVSETVSEKPEVEGKKEFEELSNKNKLNFRTAQNLINKYVRPFTEADYASATQEDIDLAKANRDAGKERKGYKEEKVAKEEKKKTAKKEDGGKKAKPETIADELLNSLGITPTEPTAPTEKAGKKKPVNVSNKSELAELEDQAEGDKKTIIEAAKKGIATLKSIFPDMEIYIHEDADSYNETMSEVGGVANSRGNFAFERDANNNPTGRGRIDINLSNAKDTTVAHELVHAVLLKEFGDNPAVFKAFRDRMSKILRADLNEQVTAFEKLYSGQDVAPEEYLTELAALLSQGGETVEYKPSTLRKVAALINEFVSKITKGKFQPFRSEVDFINFVGFLNQISGAISEGGVIEQLNTQQAYSEGRAIQVPADFKAVKYKSEKKSKSQIGDYTFPSNIEILKISNLPIKTLEEVVKQYKGRVVIITSDATGYGVDSDGEPILGGAGFASNKINVNDGIGFASLNEGTVKGTYTRAEKAYGFGKVLVLIMVQPPHTTINNSYGAKYMLRGLLKIGELNAAELEKTKNAIKNFVIKSKAVQEEFKSEAKKARDAEELKQAEIEINKLKKLKENGKVLTKEQNAAIKKYDAKIKKKEAEGKVEEVTKQRATQKALFELLDKIEPGADLNSLIKEFLNITTFTLRKEIGLGILPSRKETRTDKRTTYSKIAFNNINYSIYDFLKEYGDKTILTEDMMLNNKGGVLVGGFELDVTEVEQREKLIKEIQSKGILHPLFNAKLPGKNHFRLDDLYGAQENFGKFAVPDKVIDEDKIGQEDLNDLVRKIFTSNSDYEPKFRSIPLNERTYTHLKIANKTKFKDEILAPKGFLKEKEADVATKVAKGEGFIPLPGAAEQMAEATMVSKAQVDVYHGSPYDFDKFTTEKIGTGEGAQAFGWGLYFTDIKSIAENYAEKLSRKRAGFYYTINKDGEYEFVDLNNLKHQSYILASEKTPEEAFEELINRDYNENTTIASLRNYKGSPKSIAAKFLGIKEDAVFLEGSKDEVFADKGKKLYQVSLHEGKSPSEYTWLEWDKPLSNDVKDKIIQKVYEVNQNPEITPFFSSSSFIVEKINSAKDGRQLYGALENLVAGDKNASLFLLSAGIDGIKYPAESISRGATSDTARGFNYVVFDENAVTIKSKSQKERDNKIKDFIEGKRKAGESDKDIKAGLELVADKLGLTSDDINNLMSKEPKETKPTEPKKKLRRMAERFVFKGWEVPESLAYYTPTKIEEADKKAKELVDELGVDNTVKLISENPEWISVEFFPRIANAVVQEITKQQDDIQSKLNKAEDKNLSKRLEQLSDMKMAVYGKVMPASTRAGLTLAMYKDLFEGVPFDHVREVQRLFEISNEKTKKLFISTLNELNLINDSAIVKVAENVSKTIGKSKVEKAKSAYESSKRALKDIWNRSKNVGIAETPWDRARKNINFDKALAKAAKDFVVYKSVQFTQFLKEVSDMLNISESDIDKDHLKGIFEKVKAEQIQKGIKGVLSDMDMSLKDLIIDHYSGLKQTEQSLVEKLKERFGLEEADAKAVADEVSKQLRVLTAKEKIKAIKKSGLSLGQWVDELLSLSENGSLEYDDIKDAFAKKIGLRELTTEQLNKIETIAKALVAEKDPRKKSLLAQELEDYKQVLKTRYGLGSFLVADYLSNLFASIGSNLANVVGNVLESLGLTTELFFNSLAKGNFRDIPIVLNQFAVGTGRGAVFTKQVVTEGKASYKSIEDIKPRGLFELLPNRPVEDLTTTEKFIRSALKYKALKAAYDFNFKFWNRLMMSMDALSGVTNTELGALYKATKDANKLGLKGKERSIFINKELGLSYDVLKNALKTAKELGYEKGSKQYDRLIQDLIIEGRSEETKKYSKEYSMRATLTQEPPSHTLVGAIASGINTLSKKYKGTKFIFPVVNTFANLIIKGIERSPFEFVSLGVDAMRLKTGGITEEELSNDEIKRRLKAATVFTLAGVALLMMAGGADEDDNEFDIYGSGTGDKDLDAMLRKKGWKPYSIRLTKDGGYFSFEYTPIGFLLGFVGDLRDMARYKSAEHLKLKQKLSKDLYKKNYDELDEDEKLDVFNEMMSGKYKLDDEYLDKIAKLTLTPVKLTGELIKSVGAITKIMSGDIDAAITYLSSLGRGVLSPRYGGEIKDIFDNKLYDTKDAWAVITSNIPFITVGKVKLDGFGRDITKYDRPEEGAAGIVEGLKYLVTRRAYAPSRGTELDIFLAKNMIKVLPPKNDMFYTDEVYEKYTKLRGVIAIEMIEEDLSNGVYDDLSPMSIQQEIDRILSKANAEAKDEINKEFFE
jgi:hypothetical protein